MINIPRIPVPEQPAFFDLVIAQTQSVLAAQLPWLTYAFGRSQNLVKEFDKKTYQYPAVHIRRGEYQDVSPNNSLGNFSFFLIKDPQNVIFNPHSYNRIEADYALIFWLDLSTIFTGSTERNTESLKMVLMDILSRRLYLTYGRLTVRTIMEEARNIYREYSLKEVDTQFLMSPYAGFRFEGKISFNESCLSSLDYLRDPRGAFILDPSGAKIPIGPPKDISYLQDPAPSLIFDPSKISIPIP